VNIKDTTWGGNIIQDNWIQGDQVGLNNLSFAVGTVKRVVVENKEKHAAEFHAAYVGWVETCRQSATTMMERFDASAEPDEMFRFPTAPVSHEDDYSRVVDMLEYTTDSTVALTESEFEQYMRDQWSWSAGHQASFMAYTQ